MKVYVLLTTSNDYRVSGFCGCFASEQNALNWIPMPATVERTIFNDALITFAKTDVALYSIVESEVQ